MPKSIKNFNNVFHFQSFLVEESGDDRFHPFMPYDRPIFDMISIVVEGDRNFGS